MAEISQTGYPEDVFERILEVVDMHELLSKYGYEPARGTNIYRCMFHNDSNPSANVIQHGKNHNKFHCFTCNRSWSPVDFVCEIEGCGEKKAIAILDEMFKLKLGCGLSNDDIIRLRLERELKLREKRQRKEKVRKQLIEIADEMRLWKEIEDTTHLTRGEYRKGVWNCSDTFFRALKMQEYLDWLYCSIAKLTPPECMYNYIQVGEVEDEQE